MPPGYEATVPDDCFVYRSPTNNVFVFLRAFYQDPKNLSPAVTLIERCRIYPLDGKGIARPMQFPDASGVPVDMLPISDGTAFDALKTLVDSEGQNLADSDSLGICWQRSASPRADPSSPMPGHGRFSTMPRERPTR